MAGRRARPAFPCRARGAAAALEPEQAEEEQDAEGDGVAHRAVEAGSGELRGRAGPVAVEGGAVGAGGRAEGTAEAAEFEAHRLAVMNPAGEQVEQDASVEHPGDQRAVVAGAFHGRRL